MKSVITDALGPVLAGEGIPEETAVKLSSAQGADIVHLLSAANEVRQNFHADEISLCSIVNAKSGLCPEDCAFCAQSAHYDTGSAQYDLISSEEMVKAAKSAAEYGARE